jgi:F-type H+-transporting ATPase subunit epsilon
MSTAETLTRTNTASSAEGPLRCSVVTPERTVLDQGSDYIVVTLYDGELGVLPGRAPLIGRLGQGELRLRTAGKQTRYYIDGGFVQVRDDVVTLLTSRAVASEEIDLAAAQRELGAAQALAPTAPAALADKERAIARARALIRIANG